MVRIVSGSAPYQDPGLAFLKGWEGGEERKRKARQDQQEQVKLMLTIQKAMGDYASEQQKTLADINARAQMGDAMALQQQMLEAQAAGAPPEEKMIREFTGALGKITDEKARAKAVPVLEELLAQAQTVKQRKAAEGMIADAEKNGWIPQGEFQMRLDSGESPGTLTKEIGKIKEERTLTGMAKEKNAAALAQMQALLEAFPEGPERLQGEFLATSFMDDQAAQEKPGEGARRLQELQNILLGGQQRMETESAALRSREGPYMDPKARGAAIDDLRRKLKADPTEKEIRAEMRYRDPNAGKVKRYGDTPRQVKYEEAEAAERESLKAQMAGSKPTEVAAGVHPDTPNVVMSALEGGAEAHGDLVKALMQAGVPLTPENLEAARSQLKQYKTGKVAATGGADRKRLAR